MKDLVYGWHFARVEERPSEKKFLVMRDGEPVPIGYWVGVQGPIEMCDFGLHFSSTVAHALQYGPGWGLSRIEAREVKETAYDKSVARFRRVAWWFDARACVMAYLAKTTIEWGEECPGYEGRLISEKQMRLLERVMKGEVSPHLNADLQAEHKTYCDSLTSEESEGPLGALGVVLGVLSYSVCSPLEVYDASVGLEIRDHATRPELSQPLRGLDAWVEAWWRENKSPVYVASI